MRACVQVLTPGVVVAVRTACGQYSKIRVDRCISQFGYSSYNLDVTWFTYD